MNDWTKSFQTANFPTIRELYAAHGIEDRVECRYFDTGHDYDRPKREYTYRWFERWLRGSTETGPLVEPETTTFPIEMLEGLKVDRPEDKGFAELRTTASPDIRGPASGNGDRRRGRDATRCRLPDVEGPVGHATGPAPPQ